MKRFLSVCMLVIRSSIYPVLGVLGLLALGQTIFFVLYGLAGSGLYRALDQIPVLWTLCGALVLISFFLSRSLCNRGGNLNNALLRLSLSEKQLFAIQAVYNTLVFIMVFLFQGLLLLLYALWYGAMHPERMDPMTILVTAYQHWAFHTVFPLENILGALLTLAVILGLGICTAAYPMRQRHRLKSLTTFTMTAVSVFYLFLQQETAHLEVTSAAAYAGIPTVLCIFSALCGVITLEVDDHG